MKEEKTISLWICPLCGKHCSIKHYDPSNFVNDILILLLRGLGKGKSFNEIDRYSLLDGSDPALLALIRDRVAVVHDFLFEDRSEEQDDLIDDINAALDVDEGFDNLLDAAEALLAEFLESDKEEIPEYTEDGALVIAEHKGADAFEPESELDREIRLEEAAAAEEEGEDINDFEEEIVD